VEGDPLDEMSIVDDTKCTASASAYAPSATMFFPLETLAKELKMAELIKYLFHNVCQKLTDQNQDVFHQTYVDLQSFAPAHGEYQANLSLDPTKTRIENYVSVKRLSVPKVPFIVGNDERGSTLKHTQNGFWFDAAKIKKISAYHF
jgi:hypothetical protein